MTQQAPPHWGQTGQALVGDSGLIMPPPWEELGEPTASHLGPHLSCPRLGVPSGGFWSAAWGRSAELRQEALRSSPALPWEVFRTNPQRRENQTKHSLPGKCNNLFLYFVFF